ncbi:hypothetical protein BJD55_gp139 [Gordonia phage Yvonnetastic]|uniref:Uncharacterized protein n=1 Tax=Gordonia phage Yvonnetastic TaxID=1821566 RepID=A0A142K944_9CAUD|nr:hypothetical protein BJD55_gp139 [Gordonia phage Yvonnetastic]AMS02627.1 hypothetical protein SEA_YVONNETASTIC_83 [Gordonia phage Yvonnetastic]WKW86059.1 hypothetical protein SEA_JONJAMES_85 [Gordonia Phage JonJames]
MSELDDAEVDYGLSLAIPYFDPTDCYPEWSTDTLRDAYRAGWEDRELEYERCREEGRR